MGNSNHPWLQSEPEANLDYTELICSIAHPFLYIPHIQRISSILFRFERNTDKKNIKQSGARG